MGAEGKYDLKLVNSDSIPLLEVSGNSSIPISGSATSVVLSKKSEKSSVLVNRKSSSTPSLPEATENTLTTTSVASTEQAASADNLSWKQAVETIAENVLSSELENHPDLSLINHTQSSTSHIPGSDLATITENLTLSNENVTTKNNASSSSSLVRHSSFMDEKMSNIETNNKMNTSNTVNAMSKSILGSIRSISGAREALDVFDKMREGVDMLRNNTNNIISSELPHISSPSTMAIKPFPSASKSQNTSCGGSKFRPIHSLKQNKRQIVPVEESCSYPQLVTTANVVSSASTPVASTIESSASTKRNQEKSSIVPITLDSGFSLPNATSIPIVVSTIPSDYITAVTSITNPTPEIAAIAASVDSAASENVIVTNPMSISVPNLTSSTNSDSTNQIMPVSPPGFLETFAALARRRSNQNIGTGINSFVGNSGNGNNSNAFSSNNQPHSNVNNLSNNQQLNSFFPRGQNSVSSLVKLALSSNFHTGLLSTAQSYPSLTSSATNTSNNILNSCSGIASAIGGQNTAINPALTMSLTSTSSDSEQVSFDDFLDSCRAPTLLGELDDEEEMEDDNDDEENEDEYEEVGVSSKKK